MTGAGRRGAALAAGVAFHLCALGLLGYSGLLALKLPKQEEPVYEVALVGSGSRAAALPQAAPAPAQAAVQEIAPPRPDDIVEERTVEKSPVPPTEKTAATPQEAAPAKAESAAAPGNGQGEGVGEGTGNGDKAGVGNSSAVDANAIQSPAVAPALLRAAPPDYPPGPRRRGVEGTAWLRVLLDRAGVPESVEVVESAGDVYLDEAAAAAVEEWRFSPGLDGQGQPVRCYVQLPVAFRLN